MDTDQVTQVIRNQKSRQAQLGTGMTRNQYFPSGRRGSKGRS